MDTSDEDVKGAQLPAHPPHHVKRRNRAFSQENISHSSNQSLAPESHADPDAEEEELKRKLEELASNISDKEVSSDEEECGEKERAKKPEMSSSSDDMARDVRKV
ncbi:MELPH protein, partial [Callaeas wilsoni]|nr:MELPH protein [Callaeas wilsoni]